MLSNRSQNGQKHFSFCTYTQNHPKVILQSNLSHPVHDKDCLILSQDTKYDFFKNSLLVLVVAELLHPPPDVTEHVVWTRWGWGVEICPRKASTTDRQLATTLYKATDSWRLYILHKFTDLDKCRTPLRIKWHFQLYYFTSVGVIFKLNFILKRNLFLMKTFFFEGHQLTGRFSVKNIYVGKFKGKISSFRLKEVEKFLVGNTIRSKIFRMNHKNIKTFN